MWTACGRADPQKEMGLEILHQQLPRAFGCFGNEISPKVPSENPGQKVDHAWEDQQPSCQEVQAPTPTVLVEDLEGPTCADGGTLVREEGDALFPAAVLVVSADGQFEQRRCQIIANFAPVQPWVAHEDDDATERQRHETQGDDPVSGPHPAGVPGIHWSRGRSGFIRGAHEV